MSGSAVTPEAAAAPLVRRRSLRLGRFLLAVVVLFGVGWTVLWLVARHEADRAITAWIAHEAVEGRVWTCPNEAIAGYPFHLVLACDHPTFRGALLGGVIEGGLAGITARTPLYWPATIAVKLQSPAALHDLDGSAVIDATWTRADLTLGGTRPGDPDGSSIEATDVAVTVHGTNPVAVAVASVQASVREVRRDDPLPDIDLALVVAGLRNAEADAAFGSADPVSLDVTAIATRFEAAGPTLPELLEPWRKAGGRLRLRSVTLAKGPFRANGEGSIGLDEAHRAAGQINARFTGLEPVAQRWGIPIGAVKLGGLLSNLLGGKTAAPADTADLALPLVAKDGHLRVGPVKTAVSLPPLY